MQFFPRWFVLGPALTAVVPLVNQGAAVTLPLAHWPLERDLRDAGPHHFPTRAGGVQLEAEGQGARFDGRGGQLVVPASPTLDLGAGDFTAALWIEPSAAGDDDAGELLSLFDAASRTGFQLGLRDNTGVTSSQSNTRQLQFGIDAGSDPQWRDEGRPGNAVLAFGFTVHGGHLYAGTCEPARDDAGHVYRYVGPGRWEDLGKPDRANAVSGLVTFQDALYVGTAKYRLEGSALPESENVNLGGGVYRLEGRAWKEVGRLPQCEAIGGMVVYKGRLYVSSLYKPDGFFRYEKDGVWTPLETPGFRVVALAVFDGFLWASSYDGAWVARFDGSQWKVLPRVGENTQTYSFAILNDRLCVGTWPSGRVYRLTEDEQWEDLGRLGEEKEVMAMAVHNGKLYGGTLPLAEVYRYDGGTTWTRLQQIDATPDVLYRRAWSMAQFVGRLFWSTLPSGKIFSMEAGPMVTLDRELERGRRHVAAVRRDHRLELWVDGKLAAESVPFDPARFNLSAGQPLRIGGGESSSWNGRLRDVRLYSCALSADEIASLARR